MSAYHNYQWTRCPEVCVHPHGAKLATFAHRIKTSTVAQEQGLAHFFFLNEGPDSKLKKIFLVHTIPVLRIQLYLL
jgi:hypothetical protein